MMELIHRISQNPSFLVSKLVTMKQSLMHKMVATVTGIIDIKYLNVFDAW
jgi:hypothetical protein